MASPPEINVSSFLSIETRSQLSAWLRISDGQLKFIAYAEANRRYLNFEINKKNGGKRPIKAPRGVLKDVQRRISLAVDAVRKRSLISNGFESGRSIHDHAKPHRSKRWVIVVDIKDFFPSINFGRVRAAFMAPPFGFNSTVATLLAQLCTDGDCLPQGAPSSPPISNLICIRLDRMLTEIASRSRCSVSRYADDICFSTGHREVPKYLAYLKEGKYFPSKILEKIFADNGFSINPVKFRVSPADTALVTGLKFRGGLGLPRKWKRELRAQLNLFRKYGEDSGGIMSSWSGGVENSNFAAMLEGKVGYLAWLDKKSGTQFSKRLASSFRQLPSIFSSVNIETEIDILVEGVSDEILMKAALSSLQGKGMFQRISLNFLEIGKKGGPELEKVVRTIASTGARRNLTIALFDCDDGEILTKLGLMPSQGIFSRMLASGVYVGVIKAPTWVADDQYCIESLLHSSTFDVKDSSGRRIFLSSEFSESGLHISKKFFRSRINKKSLIVDSDVYCVDTGKSMALAKHAFASIVASGASSGEDFYGFSETFKMIQEISFNYHAGG